MKKIKIILVLLSLSTMNQLANAQNCPADKVRISIGSKGHSCTCKSKCVTPAEVASYQAIGWYVGECAHFCWVGWRTGDEVNSAKTSLTEVYPNPASGALTIEFTLSQQGEVTLEVFDLTGRFVTTIAHNIFEAESNELVWDASVLTQGIYFIKMKAAGFNSFKKISVVK